jgi:hypothetical protein
VGAVGSQQALGHVERFVRDSHDRFGPADVVGAEGKTVRGV